MAEEKENLLPAAAYAERNSPSDSAAGWGRPRQPQPAGGYFGAGVESK